MNFPVSERRCKHSVRNCGASFSRRSIFLPMGHFHLMLRMVGRRQVVFHHQDNSTSSNRMLKWARSFENRCGIDETWDALVEKCCEHLMLFLKERVHTGRNSIKWLDYSLGKEIILLRQWICPGHGAWCNYSHLEDDRAKILSDNARNLTCKILHYNTKHITLD